MNSFTSFLLVTNLDLGGRVVYGAVYTAVVVGMERRGEVDEPPVPAC